MLERDGCGANCTASQRMRPLTCDPSKQMQKRGESLTLVMIRNVALPLSRPAPFGANCTASQRMRPLTCDPSKQMQKRGESLINVFWPCRQLSIVEAPSSWLNNLAQEVLVRRRLETKSNATLTQ